jgi:hypothetical protein
MDEVFETVAVHAYKDDETSTIATDFVADVKLLVKLLGCILPPDFDPHRVDNPLPAYRKAAEFLEKYNFVDKSVRLGSTENLNNNTTIDDLEPLAQNEGVNHIEFNDEDIDVEKGTTDDIHVTEAFYDSFNEARCLSAQTKTNPLNSDTPASAVNLEISSKVYNLDGSIDDFIESLSDRELLGYNEPFQSFEYLSRTWIRKVNMCYAKANPMFLNAGKYQSYLGFRPIEVVRQTLAHTTQMAKLATGIPMRRHVQSLFPFLNRRRIDETVVTDTFFASADDVSRAKCAQVFYSLTSHFINIYSLRTEADGPKAFEDFARAEGLPNAIRCDRTF